MLGKLTVVVIVLGTGGDAVSPLCVVFGCHGNAERPVAAAQLQNSARNQISNHLQMWFCGSDPQKGGVPAPPKV